MSNDQPFSFFRNPLRATGIFIDNHPRAAKFFGYGGTVVASAMVLVNACNNVTALKSVDPLLAFTNDSQKISITINKEAFNQSASRIQESFWIDLKTVSWVILAGGSLIIGTMGSHEERKKREREEAVANIPKKFVRADENTITSTDPKIEAFRARIERLFNDGQQK
jgi:hypothetical protein